MKTWAAMYVIIWLAFFEILVVLFPVADYSINIIFHAILGIGILYFAFYVRRAVLRSACPDRIKRIVKATFAFAVFQGVLGAALAAGISFSLGSLFSDVISFLHVVVAITIITQASSSATAFDMWEEKEFDAKALAQ